LTAITCISGGFFQELHLHAEFSELAFLFPQARPLIDREGRLLARVRPLVGSDQFPRVPALMPRSLATWAIGRDVSITIFPASS
jgi:hypothetical protein